MIVAWTPTSKAEINLERILGCACGIFGAIIGAFALYSTTELGWGWAVAMVLLALLTAGAVFARFGAWRPRDSFASAGVVLVLLVALTLLTPSPRPPNLGKILLGMVVVTAIGGCCVAVAAWLTRRVLGDRPIGGGALIVAATFVTTTLLYFGVVLSHQIASSWLVLVVSEVSFALLAGIATQRIAPVRNVIACGSGASVIVALVVTENYLRDRLELDAKTLSTVFLIVAGYVGAAIGAKLRREPPATFHEFD